MSHPRERTEKICLNCNASLQGRYCHVCGQENTEPRQSLWELVTHFFEDITHFDGKFFKTMAFLASRPGFLPLEYVKGRRVRYLHPIRMYVFTSAVFFFVFYSMVPELSDKPFTDAQKDLSRDSIQLDLNTGGIPLSAKDYSSAREYDSVQKTLSSEKRTGWLGRQLVYRSIHMNEKYKGRGKDLFHNMIEGLVHSLPYLLFVSLPLYALFLKLLYFRTKYLYTDNAIFLIYLYIFSFITLLVYFALSKLGHVPHLGWLDYLIFPVFIYGIIYTIIAMKRFYHGGTGVVVLKFVIFNVLALVTVIILFLGFLLLTLFRV